MGLSGCAVNLVTAVMLLLQCEPLERQWNDEVPGSCRHVQRTTNAGYFAGSKFFSLGFFGFGSLCDWFGEVEKKRGELTRKNSNRLGSSKRRSPGYVPHHRISQTANFAERQNCLVCSVGWRGIVSSIR